MTRAFVAICPPPAVLDAVEARSAGLALPDARFTPRVQWHITVQFLGNNADVDAVVGALEEIPIAPASVQLVGAGAIGGVRNRGTVFGLGAQPLDWLQALARVVGAQLVPLGYELDIRPYLPHLTLARCKKRTDMSAARASIGDEPIGDPWLVDRVTVFESETLRSGAVHTPRGELSFSPP